MSRWTDTELNALTEKVIGFCIGIHSKVGPGLMESRNGPCLAFDLDEAGITYRREVPVPLVYKGVRLDCGYRLDFVIEEVLVVEIKSVERILPVHKAQLLTYLRLTGLPIGLVINFNVPLLKDGIVRMRN